MSTKEKSFESPDLKEKKEEVKQLILHNDDHNTFEYVIELLVEVCEHDENQAEQCALITHYKGKCDIKSGSMDELLPYRRILAERGLNVTVD